MKKKWIIAIVGVFILLLFLAFFLLDIGSWQKLDMQKLTQLDQTTRIYDDQGELLTGLYASENRKSLSVDEIPSLVAQAFVAIEDARFYQHHGVDFYRIFGALASNIRAGGIEQGASTITQQLIKLTHLSSEKTLSRKAQEAWLALQLERKATKDEILTMYLNTVYFGNGAYGIASAAETYFGKEVGQLSLSEAALLAAIVKSPSTYAPHIHPENALKRRNLVLQAMLNEGYITRMQADEAMNEGIDLVETASESQGGWYADYILEQASLLLEIDIDEIYTGGYQIYSTISAQKQKTLDELYEQSQYFPPNASDGTLCESAFICVENGSGAIKCLEGGRRYEVRRGLNRATQMRRQPGSTLKPLSVYAAAVDLYGYTPVSLLQDVSREFAEGYIPSNASGTEYGTVTLRQALSQSMNLASLDLISKIGVESSLLYAQKFRLPLTDRDRNISLALGCVEDGVTPLEVCAAYSAIAASGEYHSTYIIERICDSTGRELYVHQNLPVRILKDTSAALLTDVLRTAVLSGTAKALSTSGLQIAGKTGTVASENGGNQDIWAVACTPLITCTAWMGFDRTDSSHVLSEGTVGGGYTARLAAAFLKDSCSSDDTDASFSIPESMRRVVLDRAALEQEGKLMLADVETPETYRMEELLPLSGVPTATSDLWRFPETPDTFRLTENADGSLTFSLISLDSYVEYQLMCAEVDADETVLVATLQGQKGAYLTHTIVPTVQNGTASYWIEPVHRLRQEAGLEAKGEATQIIEWNRELLPWLQQRLTIPSATEKEAASTPVPDEQEPLLRG